MRYQLKRLGWLALAAAVGAGVLAAYLAGSLACDSPYGWTIAVFYGATCVLAGAAAAFALIARRVEWTLAQRIGAAVLVAVVVVAAAVGDGFAIVIQGLAHCGE